MRNIRAERFRTVPYSLYIILLFRRERFVTVPVVAHHSIIVQKVISEHPGYML